MKVLGEIREGLWIAWDAVRANKMRSVLATLGIVIGVVTVTLMGTAIDGLKRAFVKSVSVLGGDVLYVERREWFIMSYQDWLKTRKRKRITLDEARRAEKLLTSARAVAPVVAINAPLQYKNRESMQARVIGTTDAFQFTSGVTVWEGRFFSPGEAEGGRPVCVIGAGVATNLFPQGSPLGETIRVGPSSYQVVGVLEPQGSFLGMMSLDNQVFLPLDQLMRHFWNNPDIAIQIKIQDIEQLEEAKEEVRGVMRRVRGVAPGDPDDFAINQQEQFLTLFNRVVGMIASVGLFITGLSLFVGGIGVMNIMFVSVAERTREIGIRKAIGAKRRAILLQFLLEAASICLLGGAAALAIAFPLTLIMANFIPATMSLPVAGLALGVSLVTGVVAGFVPAWRAARMNPVDALRNE
jgi:putative ABC transport system permease protein